MATPEEINWGECHHDDCSEPCPMDLPGIIVDDEIYCSPDCAKDVLQDRVAEPTVVKLHDPQFAVDREELGIEPGVVDIWRLDEPATDLINLYADLYPSSFRVA